MLTTAPWRPFGQNVYSNQFYPKIIVRRYIFLKNNIRGDFRNVRFPGKPVENTTDKTRHIFDSGRIKNCKFLILSQTEANSLIERNKKRTAHGTGYGNVNHLK